MNPTMSACSTVHCGKTLTKSSSLRPMALRMALGSVLEVSLCMRARTSFCSCRASPSSAACQ